MAKVRLTGIDGRIIFDSRGKETIEVLLNCAGYQVKAAVPSGKSKGSFEAATITPQLALKNIKDLSQKLIEKDFESINEFDQFLLKVDGTENKERLGGNTILALSIAFTRVLAATEGVPLYRLIEQISGRKHGLPKLFINLINGGLHSPQNLNPLPFQEYLIIPESDSAEESLKIAYEFIDTLKYILEEEGQNLILGDEGGFVVSGDDPKLGLEIFVKAVKKGNFSDRVKFALDVAASSFYNQKDNCYKLRSDCFSPDELLKKYQGYVQQFPLLSIEDPFNEENWKNWTEFMSVLGDKIWIIGDDLTVTNTKRIRKAEEQKAANALIIKPNQIGTVSETIAAVNLAKRYDWKVIVSHRSGETDDTFIADLAFGVGADGLKSGSPLQKERLIKYNRLIEIERSL